MIELRSDMKAVAVGLGKSGLAAVQYLHSLGLKTAASEYKKQITAEEQAVLVECSATCDSLPAGCNVLFPV